MIKIETPEQFNEAVAQDKLVIACFSAPWCGSCKMVAPHVAKLSEELADTPFLKIDAGELEEFVEEIEVDSFPTFRAYKGGKVLGEYTSSKYEKTLKFDLPVIFWEKSAKVKKAVSAYLYFAMPRPLFLLLGDSITQDGSNPANGGWICLLQHRYNRSLDICQRGLSGYTTRWFLEQVLPTLEQEFASKTLLPSLITLWLGANDAAHLDGDGASQHVPLVDYRRNLQTIVRIFQTHVPQAEILLITPPAVNDTMRLQLSSNGKLDRSNEVAGMYAAACVEAAASTGIEVLDLYTIFNAMPREERDACLSDGLHLSLEGNAVMDEQLRLKIASAFPTLTAQLEAWEHPSYRDLIAAEVKNTEV